MLELMLQQYSQNCSVLLYKTLTSLNVTTSLLLLNETLSENCRSCGHEHLGDSLAGSSEAMFTLHFCVDDWDQSAESSFHISCLFFLFFHFRNAAHGFSLIPVDSLKVTMKEILQKALKKRKGSQKGSGNSSIFSV